MPTSASNIRGNPTSNRGRGHCQSTQCINIKQLHCTHITPIFMGRTGGSQCRVLPRLHTLPYFQYVFEYGKDDTLSSIEYQVSTVGQNVLLWAFARGCSVRLCAKAGRWAYRLVTVGRPWQVSLDNSTYSESDETLCTKHLAQNYLLRIRSTYNLLYLSLCTN